MNGYEIILLSFFFMSSFLWVRRVSSDVSPVSALVALLLSWSALEAGNTCPTSDILIDANGRGKTGWTSYIHDSISSPTDEDYYKIVLTSPAYIYINVNNKTHGGYKTSLDILASDCNTVKASKSGTDYTLETKLGPGTYYARVHYNNGATNYKIKAKFPYIADLKISKSVDKALANVGDSITFTLVAKNDGPSNSRIKVTDTIPSGFGISSITDNRGNFSCSHSGNTVTCGGNRNFSPNGTVTINIVTTAISEGNYTNSADVASTNYRSDPDLSNNSDSVDVSVGASTCGGCDCSLDREPDNDSYPVKITDFDGIDHNATTCLSGKLPEYDEDYYYFTTGAEGNLTINISSPNNKAFNFWLYYDSNPDNDGGYSNWTNYGNITSETITITLAENETVILYSGESGQEDAQYQYNLEFQPAPLPVVYNADDLCYKSIETSGFCVGFGPCSGGMNCKKSYPLKNIGDSELSDIVVDYDESGLGGTFANDCGVDPSGSGTCHSASNIDFGPFGFLGTATEYVLTEPMPAGDDSVSVWTRDFISGSCFNGENFYATYVKNGVRHKGKIKACPNTDESSGERDFILRHQENVRGDVKALGNTVLCELNSAGQCVEPTGTASNAGTYLEKAPSSSATLTLPDGASVIYARLYWQGREAATSNYHDWTGVLKKKAETIKLKKDTDSGYTTLTADIADFSVVDAGHWVRVYSASADASSVVTGGGTYSVDTASFETNTGETHSSNPSDGLGNYGAWLLVVVYKDPNTDKTKNVSIFDGYKIVSDEAPAVNVPVSGFLTPKVNDVDSTLYIFTAEGDKYIDGDHLKMAGERYSTTLQDIAPTSDNAFDSRIDITAARNPNLSNNNGIDLQQYNVGTTGHNIIKNNETGAKFQFTSTGDMYFPSVIVFSTEIYVPHLCYDYTYGQNGHFMTAESIKPPVIQGTFTDDPIDVKLYFKNLENSDVTITNLQVDIDPIDSNTTYRSESTAVASPGEAPIPIPDSGRDVGPTHNNEIPVGDVGSLDYFYVYYSLNHSQEDINATINAILRYDMVVEIGGETITLKHTSTKIEEMDPCQGSSIYEPVPGIFNVVHKAYQNDALTSKYYYNLPTQVAGRYDDNLLVESMDIDNLDEPKPIMAVAGVEMLNMDGFHYVTATCTDNNAIVISTKRVWVIFDSNSEYIKPLDKSKMQEAGFFAKASQNAAFRLFYNAADENGSIIGITKLAEDSYELVSLPSYGSDDCSDAFTQTHPGAKISSYCGSGAMSGAQLKECMECIYGLKTYRMCSRDNFAIRPEAFDIQLTDSNSTHTPIPQGSAKRNIAAGYDYDIDINATMYGSTVAAPGYGKNFNGLDASGDSFGFKWTSPKGASVCNDTEDRNKSVTFSNGMVDDTIKIDQVGEYTLLLRDKTWSKVDFDSSVMTHHSGSYYASGTDCLLDTSVASTTSTTLNGCYISSNYPDQNFTDYNVEVFPYEFKLDLTNHTPEAGKNFVYMADILDLDNDDKNISYFFEGKIYPKGKLNDEPLSNFTDGCYAYDIDLNIPNDYNGTQSMVNELYMKSDPSVEVNGTINKNDTDSLLSTKFFKKDQNGSTQVYLRYNIKREIDKALNPVLVNFGDLNASFHTPVGVYADGNASYKIKGETEDRNESVYFYYVKAHVKDAKIKGNDGNLTGRYEVYCYGADCNTTALNNITATKHSDDPRWWINPMHTNKFYGIFTSVTQKTTSPTPPVSAVVTSQDTASTSNVHLTYDESRGYPYRAVMQIFPDKWLIYNKYDANATHNEFTVRFESGGGKWIGKRDSTVSTKTSDIDKERILEW